MKVHQVGAEGGGVQAGAPRQTSQVSSHIEERATGSPGARLSLSGEQAGVHHPLMVQLQKRVFFTPGNSLEVMFSDINYL